MSLWQEGRRRRVFRLIGLYVVGAWLVIQVAATFFPAWGIPDTALRYLITAAVIGFPPSRSVVWVEARNIGVLLLNWDKNLGNYLFRVSGTGGLASGSTIVSFTSSKKACV